MDVSAGTDPESLSGSSSLALVFSAAQQCAEQSWRRWRFRAGVAAGTPLSPLATSRVEGMGSADRAGPFPAWEVTLICSSDPFSSFHPTLYSHILIATWKMAE